MEIKTIPVGAIKANCYLLVSGDEMAVIDPGDEAEKIISAIKEEGKKTKYIIYTHSHFDHVSAGNEVKKSEGGETLIHSGEKDLFSGLDIDRFIKEGDILEIGEETLKIIHNPGHTPGSICLIGSDFIFTGDTLFRDGTGRTDLVGGSEKEMEISLERICNLINPGMRIYPGHGPDFVGKN